MFDCLSGYWGLFCNEWCDLVCVDNICNWFMGVCVGSCEFGKYGEFCN